MTDAAPAPAPNLADAGPFSAEQQQTMAGWLTASGRASTEQVNSMLAADGVAAVAPISVDAAKAEISRLRSGGDKQFSAAYLDRSDPGHQAAVDRMNALYAA